MISEISIAEITEKVFEITDDIEIIVGESGISFVSPDIFIEAIPHNFLQFFRKENNDYLFEMVYDEEKISFTISEEDYSLIKEVLDVEQNRA